MRPRCSKIVWLFAIALFLPAQDPRATITGQVVDISGASIPGAKVRAVQRSTNQATEAVTNHEGYYTLPYLAPSTYDIEVTADGFNRLRRENISLMVAEKLNLPLKLDVGNVSNEVTVRADIDALQSADASGGLNFDSLQTSEYPLNGRQVYMLMDLAPGVLFTQEQFGANGFSGTRGWDVNDSYVMNGGVKGTNSFSLNGAPISLTGTWQVAPNVDAIQEFKVQTNTYDAQIARTGGGSVNTTIKSGSNAWRGTLFDFIRNSVLDANYTQNNMVGAPRGKHITNQFGGTLGGAIRRDKDFVFFSFEGFRERVPFPVVVNVPPLDLRDGQHFTKYKWNIYDPLTGHVCVDKVDVTGACASTFIRSPFPQNLIPDSRISQVGRNILAMYPDPNTAGLTQNYVASNNTGQYQYDQPIARWDHVVSDKDRIYTMFTFQHGHEFRNQSGFTGPAESGNLYSQRTNFNVIASWTRILSSSAIFDLRASFGRFTSYFPDALIYSGFSAKKLGMTLPRTPNSIGDFPPRITIDQFYDLFGNGSNMFTWGTDNQWNVVPSMTMTHGTKTIKMGLDLVYAMRGSGSIGQANGQLAFNRGMTQHYPLRAGNSSDGAGIADLLLGLPGSGFIDWNDTYYRTWPYVGIFIQNDWKVRRNLTLNLGLRYDVQFPFVERWDRVNNGFDFNAKNPVSDQVLAVWTAYQGAYNANASNKFPYPAPPAELLGGKTFVQPGGPRRTYDTDWSNIQPRIGIAWVFAPHTVLRTGFGMFHRTATQGNYTDGFSQQTPYTNSLTGGLLPSAGLAGPYSLENPFPDGIIAPSGRALGLLTNIGRAVSFDGHQRPIPTTYQYSFGLQRNLPWKVLLDASYVGSVTNHDAMNYDSDYIPMSLFLQGQANNNFLDRPVPNPFYGILPRSSTFGAAPTIAARDLYRPFPLFNGITESTNPWSHYRYDGLQLRMEKRFTGDRSRTGALTMIFSYTFSKTFEANHRLNSWDAAEPPIHELSNYDKPQNIAFHGVWDIPFGKGRRWYRQHNKAVGEFVDGWTINWIYRFTSGVPVNKMDVVYLCDTYLTDNQTHDHWFNNDRTCYKSRPNYTLRVAEDRFPNLRQMDNPSLNIAASKTFALTERWKFNLRGEAFNVTNTPLYGGPDTGFQNVRFGMLPVGQQNFPRLVQVSGKLLF